MSSSWPSQPPVSTGNGSTAALAFQAAIRMITDPHERLLVIVGAHHFGGDANDPIRSIVGDVPWGGALLIEASPVIARELSQRIAAHNPLPRVPPERIIVSNVGIRDKERTGAATVSQSVSQYHTPSRELVGTGAATVSQSVSQSVPHS